MIACRGKAAAARAGVDAIPADWALTLSEAKTRVGTFQQTEIRFLGFRIRLGLGDYVANYDSLSRRHTVPVGLCG